MNRNFSRIFRQAARASYLLGVLSLVIGLILSITYSPVAASPLTESEWDKSSLVIDSGYGCQGDCREAKARVCNHGSDMAGTTSFEVYYSATGNPMQDGSLVGGGIIPALASGDCAELSYDPQGVAGNYKFRAIQRPGHNGGGDLWSDTCSISGCSLPTPEATATFTHTPEPTATFTNTPEPTATFTNTPEPTATFTNTPEPTATFTATPVVTPWIDFDDPDTALCEYEPLQITVTGRYELPENMSAVLQTQWYIVLPGDLTTEPIYDSQVVTGSGTFSLEVTWPGVRSEDEVVEIHVGAALLDIYSGDQLSEQNATLDYYWYPWFCDAPTPTATPFIPGVSPTPTLTATPFVPGVSPTPTFTATPEDPGASPTPTYTATPNVPGNEPTPTFTATPNDPREQVTPTPNMPSQEPTKLATLPPPVEKSVSSNPVIIPVTGRADSAAMPVTLYQDLFVNLGIGLLGLGLVLNGLSNKRK